MSLYGLVFGQNPMSDVLLAALGLARANVGRFRDCFVSNGEIAIYTRNGGGNRECWHSDGGGEARCKHRVEQREVDEVVEVRDGPLLSFKRTGRRVVETFHVCEEPNSASCACPGCVISHRLPTHPLYLRDQDDDFDSTYATVFFRFPEEFAEDLKKIDRGEKFDPDERWRVALERIGKAPSHG